MPKKVVSSIYSSPQTQQKLQVILPADMIAARVKELAAFIRQDFKELDLTIVIVLKGAFMFAADLIRELDIPLEIDFVRASSYHSGTYTTGNVVIRLEPETLHGKHVLLIEDIVDTGYTIDRLRKRFIELGAASVRVCALLDKPSRRKVDVDIDYTGFIIPDIFVCGYGIDYAEKGRQFPGVCIAETEESEEEE